MEVFAGLDYVPPVQPISFGELPHRHVYRERPEIETEAAVALVKNKKQIVQARLRSIQSVERSTITFSNLSDHPVRVVWLDFSGHEVVYSSINPNESKRYGTFVTHPWIVRDIETEERMTINNKQAIFGEEAHQMAEIRAAPLLAWKESTHKWYPKEFKDIVKTVLLCHHRLASGGKIEPNPRSPLRSIGDALYELASAAASMYRDYQWQPIKYPRFLDSDHKRAELPPKKTFGDLPKELVNIIIHALEKPKVFQDFGKVSQGAAPDIEPVSLPESVDVSSFIPKQSMVLEE